MLTFGTAVVPAQAQGNAQRGLVNVNLQIRDVIDDITIRDINVAVAAAANILANVCGVDVTVAALIAAVDDGGTFSGTCENLGGDSVFEITQN